MLAILIIIAVIAAICALWLLSLFVGILIALFTEYVDF